MLSYWKCNDLNKLFSYLLSGKLQKEQQLKKILTTVPTGKGGINGYGLGIYEIILPNSVPIWGHTGGIPGFDTFAGGTHGDRHMLTVNLNSMGRAENPGLFKSILLVEFRQ